VHNPSLHIMNLGNNNANGRLTRASALTSKLTGSTSMVQDENKLVTGKVAGDKKVVKRSVLGDISNFAGAKTSINTKPVKVEKVEKPVSPCIIFIHMLFVEIDALIA
jgi:hypothetical protein